jgi:hypothetical protein
MTSESARTSVCICMYVCTYVYIYVCMYIYIYIHMRIVEVGSDIWLRVLVIHGLNLLSPDPGTKATTYIRLSIHNVLMHIASHGSIYNHEQPIKRLAI